MCKPEGETSDRWDAAVERARLDALAGDVDGAAVVLEQAEEFGRVGATVLRDQLLLFLGRHYEAEQLLAARSAASPTSRRPSAWPMPPH
jgi:hypothetical protein